MTDTYRRWVASLECIRCRRQGASNHAHSNQSKYGKGRGIKANDYAAFSLCVDRLGAIGCHSIHDRYVEYGREVARNLENEWVAATLLRAIREGVLK
jgi:hypothetical protein